MLALIFLAAACWWGRCFYRPFLRRAINDARGASLLSDTPSVPEWMIAWPAYFVIGTLILTWATYLCAYVAQAKAQPLVYANAVTLGISAIAIATFYAINWLRARCAPQDLASKTSVRSWIAANRCELIVVGVVAVMATFLMVYTLNIKDHNRLYIGASVYSDFGPHLSMIRSFSHGHNFPTEYPHFPDGHARYHFMFQFLAGNLEFLGLPIDWAFNLPSILSFVACTMSLYSLAVVLLGSRATGVFTLIFFFFRSSFAWWDFVLSVRPIGNIWKAVLSNQRFIGRTLHEDWGLWNQNIYLNQRHLAFGLTVMFLLLIFIFPVFRELIFKWADRPKEGETSRWKLFCFTAEAWMPRQWIGCTAAGLVLGMCGFWNGAVVIAALLLLFFLGIFSWHRLEFLVIAIIAAGVGYLENRLFLGPNSLALQPSLFIGFLSPHPVTGLGIVLYYFNLLGPFLIVTPFAVFFTSRSLVPGSTVNGQRSIGVGVAWLALVFFTPIMMATVLLLTPDIAINHKYVMMAVMLLNIFAANFIERLLGNRRVLLKTAGALAAILLTATGAIDLITLVNVNRPNNAIVVNLDDPLIKWAEKNTAPDDLFLSDWYSVHPILIAGRKIFYGWPYYAWSAGYDTATRQEIVKQIYGGTDAAAIRRLVLQNHIRFILIDRGNRTNDLYKLNEDLLTKTFPQVFSQDDLVVLKVQ